MKGVVNNNGEQGSKCKVDKKTKELREHDVGEKHTKM